MSDRATEILRRLLRVPPTQFVAERNRIAKDLKAEGERELAEAVSAVRRPGVSDWALDVTAAEHSDDVAELVEAANEVLDSQEAAMEGRDAGDLRVRLKLLRVCTATVAGLASGVAERFEQTGTGSSASDITSRLTEIAANRDAISLLARGLLGAEDPGAADPFGIAAASTPARSKKRSATKTATKAQRDRALADATKALASAEADAATAERAAAKQEAAITKLEAKVADAAAKLEALRADLATASAELDARRTAADEAHRSVEAARDALAGLTTPSA